MAIYSGFSHEKWWFSIAMLVYQRVPEGNNHLFLGFLAFSAPSRKKTYHHPRGLPPVMALAIGEAVRGVRSWGHEQFTKWYVITWYDMW